MLGTEGVAQRGLEAKAWESVPEFADLRGHCPIWSAVFEPVVRSRPIARGLYDTHDETEASRQILVARSLSPGPPSERSQRTTASASRTDVLARRRQELSKPIRRYPFFWIAADTFRIQRGPDRPRPGLLAFVAC
jgi:hypothetical protein